MKGLVFRGATVADGTGHAAFKADVAVAGERIVRVSAESAEAADGFEIIDAAGAVLAPGFIDIHAHSDFSALALPLAESKSTQGVTTEVSGQCGFSPFPVCVDSAAELLRQAALWKVELDWQDYAGYRRRLEQAGSAINHRIFVGHGTLRSSVSDGEARPLNAAETAAMCKTASRALEQGASGVSAGLLYPPGCYGETDELVALGAAAAAADKPFAFHMRNEGERIIQALDEVLAVARDSGCRVHVSHLKVSGPENWQLMDTVLETIRQARNQGLRITADCYPYIASHTTLSVVLPHWVKEGGDVTLVERLRSQSMRQRIGAEVRQRYAADYWTRVTVSLVEKGGLEGLPGLTIAELAAQRRQDPVEVVLDIITESHNGVSAVFFSMSHENLLRVMAEPYVAVGSDAAAMPLAADKIRGKPHPRGFGAFPRVFARLVRESGVFSLEEAVRRMTSLPARILGLPDRGVVREGAVADLVLFDASRFSDAATFKEPVRPPEGLAMVVTAGVPVWRNGEFTGQQPGRAL